MNEDYRKGKLYAFGVTIAIICGLQNNLGCDENNPKYQALQDLLLLIKKELAEIEEK